jgi:hypothetical protein
MTNDKFSFSVTWYRSWFGRLPALNQEVLALGPLGSACTMRFAGAKDDTPAGRCAWKTKDGYKPVVMWTGYSDFVQKSQNARYAAEEEITRMDILQAFGEEQNEKH